jgi:hypothetical protein
MKKSVLFSVLALTAAAFADGDLIASAQKMNGQSQQKMDNSTVSMNTVTLTSARPESDNGWYLFADALYWHADVGNADWAERSQTLDGDTKYGVHNLDFKWSWGFKAGIGVNMNHDMWDSNLTYTWFHTSNSNSVGLKEEIPAGATQGAQTFAPSASGVRSAKHEWNIHFSMFDWELGRWYYVSKMLALRPHLGVKGGWIHQDRKTNIVTGSTTDIKQSAHFDNNFWGVGPSLGLNTLWVLGSAGPAMEHRFSLFGDVAGALMYGHFSNSYSDESEATTPETKNKVTGLNRNLAVPMLQAAMGLSWDTAFNRGRNHFMMKVGYEFQYWFRQNQYPSSQSIGKSSFDNFARYSDDLSLQGVTAELRFDF